MVNRTKQRFWVVCASCAAYIFLAALIAVASPRDGKSFLYSFGWWIVGIPVSLIGYAVLELFGTWGLELRFWQRMPGWGRITLLVMLISMAAIGITFAIQSIAGVKGIVI